MYTINATLINLYKVCRRECWLHANGIRMEHNSDTVSDGKLLHETSYSQRPNKYSEFQLEAMFENIKIRGKVDYYSPKEKMIYESKRGNKIENAHIWQVKFYIWLFELSGIKDIEGKIEYPKLRKITKVHFSSSDRIHLENLVHDVIQCINSEECPDTINSRICRSCSYYEFCYIDE